VVAQVAGQFAGVYTVDVYGAFVGRTGLLLAERRGASSFEVHPTNAGQRVMEQTFADAIARAK
jgi:hypothetical protein